MLSEEKTCQVKGIQGDRDERRRKAVLGRVIREGFEALTFEHRSEVKGYALQISE